MVSTHVGIVVTDVLKARAYSARNSLPTITRSASPTIVDTFCTNFNDATNLFASLAFLR